ncbi:MAG: winged helix-turn-helix domain-containing protein [Bdellovibrionales bacterium]|nr:winged helix-turn-helix domain-containing protein [Bdellovibrionales bacterium]
MYPILLGARSEVFDRTIDSHISHLRSKLKVLLKDSLQISCVYGVGYRLDWKNQSEK